MKPNIKQKIVSTVFGCVLLLSSFSPRLTLVGILAVTLSGIFFFVALSDT